MVVIQEPERGQEAQQWARGGSASGRLCLGKDSEGLRLTGYRATGWDSDHRTGCRDGITHWGQQLAFHAQERGKHQC